MHVQFNDFIEAGSWAEVKKLLLEAIEQVAINVPSDRVINIQLSGQIKKR